LLAFHALAAAPPPAGFSYDFEREVVGTGGAYAGYRDSTVSHGRYEADGAAEVATVHATYRWRYASNDGKSESGDEDRFVRFGVDDRLYRTVTDLDEYDAHDPAALAVWFWIPPDTPIGATLRILDHDYAVVSWSSPPPKGGPPAIEVQAHGTSRRDDPYGQFEQTWTDAYWYDPATGWVIANRWVEEDQGSFEGAAASLRWTESFDVTESTYRGAVAGGPTEREPDDSVAWGLTGLLCGLSPLLSLVCSVGAVVAGTGGLVWLASRLLRGAPPPSVIETAAYGSVQLRDLIDPAELDRFADPCASEHLAPFLKDFARKAQLAGDPVKVAVAGRRLVGFGTLDREAELGTVLAADAAVAEALRQNLRCLDFFSDVRHTEPGKTTPRYNVFETSHILRLDEVPDLDYDVDLVRRLVAEDLPALEKLVSLVYGVRASRWLGAQVKSGDVGYVARVDGGVVGFAFASLVGSKGRLHTITVHPDHRGRGIGTELVRARLRALAHLGATSVVSEIADWNLASLHIAAEHGFVPVGTMWVQTTRSARVPRPIVRR
jgi:GNAT superfamily N-acetyltransferase